MSATIKDQIRTNQASLIQERAGLPSARQTERDLAAVREPNVAPAVTPVAITSDIKSGDATKDVLNVMADAGMIDNQSTVGHDTIVPLSDSAAGLDSLTSTGIVVRTGPGSFVTRSLFSNALNGLDVTNEDGVKGRIILTLDPMLTALTVLGTTALGTGAGLVAYNPGGGGPGTGTAITSQIVAGVGIAVTNGDAVAGDPTIAQDLANPIVVFDELSQDTSNNATIVAVSTYQVCISKTTPLAAGTWTIRVQFDMRATQGSGLNISLKINCGGGPSGSTWTGGTLAGPRTIAAQAAAPGSPVGMSATFPGIVSLGNVTIMGGAITSTGTMTANMPRLIISAIRTA